MKGTRTVYCISLGLVWKFSVANFRRMLKKRAAGQGVLYEDYGTVCMHIPHDLSDFSAEDAQDLLASYPDPISVQNKVVDEELEEVF